MAIIKTLLIQTFVLLFSITAATAASPDSIPLSKGDRALLGQIEKYLNDVTSISARFIQASSSGAYAEGKVFVQRPGKMRFEYDPPTPILVISDGTWIGYYDRELEQASHALLSSTPASLLVGKKISFAKDIAVVAFRKQGNLISLTIASRDQDKEGKLTLGFQANPLQLFQWSVIDAQGVHTDVTLKKARFGEPLQAELFHLQHFDNNQQNQF